MKQLAILGSTGSIGENALRVVSALPGQFSVSGLAAQRNWRRLLEQAVEYNVSRVALADEAAAAECREAAPEGVEVLCGEAGVCEIATSDNDLLLCAIVGMAGLMPVLSAVERGIDVALATKEVLVSAGSLVCAACEQSGSNILPVDSEHSALFQAMQHRDRLPWCLRYSKPDALPAEAEIRRLILTASGGPFAGRPDVDFDKVGVRDALNHPNWSMGSKVTIDSATMMNKGLEIMEALWLFNVPLEKIDLLVHRESIVHSLVEFVDRSMLGQLSVPDMRFAIQYAMVWPERLENPLPELDLAALGTLNFSRPDPVRFPALRLAREAADAGGTLPTVLNAANEVAVECFLKEEISFAGIWHLVEETMNEHEQKAVESVQQLLDIDDWARITARRNIGGLCR